MVHYEAHELKTMTTHKPCRTLSQIFKKPKDRPQDHQRTGIVYKVQCNDCLFTYIGEIKCSWSSRGAEHDPGRTCNREAAIKQHAQKTDHDIHPRDAMILERGITSYTKRLFLESWHSTMDANTVNERKVSLRAYTPFFPV